MKKLAWVFLLLLFPLAAFAADSTSALSLTPPDIDLSLGYLSNIFGVVDGVLAGTGSQLLGAMFSVFNGAVLVLGGIVILYTLFVSTLNTAQEGEVMGKRWSSVWIPLRSVAGVALLIPKASGYSFIQIFMMWVAVMGIGAADSIWNRALDYFVGGGILIQQNTQLGATQANNNLIVLAGNTLRVLTCSSMLQKELEEYQKTTGTGGTPRTVPNFYQGIVNQITANLSTGGTVNIPNIDSTTDPTNFYNSLTGQCGSISWTSSSPIQGNSTYSAAVQQQVAQSRGLAVQSMVSQLYGPSQAIVNNYLVDNPAQNRMELGHILNPGSPPYVWGGGSLSGPGKYLLPGNTLSNAAGTYFGIMLPTLNFLANLSTFSSIAQGWVAKAKSYGWIVAGRYYYDVINLNSSVSVTESSPPTVNLSKLAGIKSNSTITNFFPGGANSTYITNLDNVVNGSANYTVGATAPFIGDAINYGSNLKYGNIGSTGGGANTGDSSSGYDDIDSILLPVMGIGADIEEGLLTLASSQTTNSNPIVALAQLGNGLVGTVFWTYVGVAIAVLVITLVLGALWGFTFAIAMVALIIPLMAIVSPILLPLLVIGLTMTFYIPLIPYIIFTFGAIGWFISVVEAIIAAPLVALGIAHPEGQEILGKAEPAVILLVNVFLRPTFMIFGLLIGMMLAYVGIWLVNQGFYPVFTSASAQATDVVSSLFAPAAYLIIYVLIVMQVVQKSFTLIYIIPDEVLKWIGGNIKGMGGEAEAEQKIGAGAKSGFEAQGQAVSKAPETAQAVSKGAVKAGKAAEARSSGTEESSDVGASSDSKGGPDSSASSSPASSSTKTGPVGGTEAAGTMMGN